MYIVEGNIGAGKSTFLKLIKEHAPSITVAPEPLEKWQDKTYGQSLLTSFYENPMRWAYTFEALTLMCRVKDHLYEQRKNNPFHIMERSIYSGYYCFAKNSHEQGFLSDIEWKIYQEWFQFLTNKCFLPKGFIYLEVDPEIAYKRIGIRNRTAEKNIQFNYIREIDHKHQDFLLNKKNIDPMLAQVPVLRIDCNIDFEHDSKKMAEYIETIKTFLHDTA